MAWSHHVCEVIKQQYVLSDDDEDFLSLTNNVTIDPSTLVQDKKFKTI
jgi:hypothetical protein